MSNKKLMEDFLLYIEEKKSRNIQTSQTSSSVGNISGSTHYVYFYPWSKVEGNRAEFFNTVEKFLSQMREWSVRVKPAQIGSLREHSVSYCTCIPNKNELIIRQSYKDLKEALDKYLNPMPSSLISSPRLFDLHNAYGYTSYEY